MEDLNKTEFIEQVNIQREFERDLLKTFVKETKEIHNKYYKKDIIKSIITAVMIVGLVSLWMYWYYHVPIPATNYNQINNSDNAIVEQSKGCEK